MAEFASNAKGNTGVALGATALGLSAINALSGNGGLGNILGGLFNGGNGCGTNTAVNRYELGLQNRISELEGEVKFREASIYTDQKLLEVYKYFDGKIEGINSRLCEQAVWNATQTATLSCMGGQIAQLMSLTKTIIPINNICPLPATATTTTGA
jgi:hypothetical protein